MELFAGGDPFRIRTFGIKLFHTRKCGTFKKANNSHYAEHLYAKRPTPYLHYVIIIIIIFICTMLYEIQWGLQLYAPELISYALKDNTLLSSTKFQYSVEYSFS